LLDSTNLTAPALRVESSSKPRSPYAVYAKNVDRIREKFSERVTEENVTNYTDGKREL